MKRQPGFNPLCHWLMWNWLLRQLWPLVTSLTSPLPQARATSSAPIADGEISWRQLMASGLVALSRWCSDVQFNSILYAFYNRLAVVIYHHIHRVSRLCHYNVRASVTRINRLGPIPQRLRRSGWEKRWECIAVWTLCRCWWAERGWLLATGLLNSAAHRL